jgi:2-succinyl-5-enolpyruvyl-6-hydroxy-3-cyclohexene-1-carboxylate synthase
MSEASNTAHLWARLIVEELVRGGVNHFFLAPGSRSTPLVLALAAHPDARRIVHFDERATAFAAVGFARGSGRAAAWVTTSGSAVANGLPALVEASADDIPLICLTADRPPELRDTGANQTIDQVGIFGKYVRWQVDLPVPTESISPRFVLSTVSHAIARMQSGPVHLNCMFREPLVSFGPDAALPDEIASWQGDAKPYTTYSPGVAVPNEEELREVADELTGARRGIVVIGRSTRAQAQSAITLGRTLGWPIFSDIMSNARLLPEDAVGVVGSYDLALLDESVAASPPDAVLWVGGRFVSKRLGQFLARHCPRTFVGLRAGQSRLDPDHVLRRLLSGDIVRTCRSLEGHVSGDNSDGDWLETWLRYDSVTASAVHQLANEIAELSEPGAAYAIGSMIPDGHGLFLGSSMPVRDADMHIVTREADVLIASSRGASGIDGTLATAAGFARGIESPVTALLGDLTFLHDLNSLALVASSDHPIIVVVLNNDGGGIFSFLPVARRQDVFEPYFGTPHGLRFDHAAAMFGLDHYRPENAAGFHQAYGEALAGGRSAVIEVAGDRYRNVEIHRLIHERIIQVLSV